MKNFTKVALHENVEFFIIYMALFTSKILIHLIFKAQTWLLLVEKVIVLAKYLDFANVFSKKLAKILKNILVLINIL